MTFYCPFCKKPLRKGKDEYYQTLVEHCTDPNEEEYTIEPRETWKCTCCFSSGMFWGSNGELFSNSSLSTGQREILHKMKTYSALGSEIREIDEKVLRGRK
jgi:hypothetical protein